MLVVASGFLKDGKVNQANFTASFSSASISPQNQISVEEEGTYRLEADKIYPAEAVWIIQNPDKGEQPWF